MTLTYSAALAYLLQLGIDHRKIGRSVLAEEPPGNAEYPLLLLEPSTEQGELNGNAGVRACHVALQVLDLPRDANGKHRTDAPGEPAAALARTLAWAEQLIEQIRTDTYDDIVPGSLSMMGLDGVGDSLAIGQRVEFQLKVAAAVVQGQNADWFNADRPEPLPLLPLGDYTVQDILTRYPHRLALIAALSEPVTVVNPYDPASPLQLAPGDTYNAPAPPAATVTDNSNNAGTEHELAPGDTLTIGPVADVVVTDTYGGGVQVPLRPGAQFTPTPAPKAVVTNPNTTPATVTELAPGAALAIPLVPGVVVTDANNPASPVTVPPGGVYASFPLASPPGGYLGLVGPGFIDVHSSEARWAFAGTWTHSSLTSGTNNLVAISTAAGATATLTNGVWGSMFILRVIASTTGGTCTVHVDGVLKATLNLLHGTTQGRYVLISGLTRGNHSVVITQTSGAGTQVILDDLIAFG